MNEIKKKLKDIQEKKIDEAVEEIDKLHDDAKMFGAIKRLNRKKPENQIIHDQEGKSITNEA